MAILRPLLRNLWATVLRQAPEVSGAVVSEVVSTEEDSVEAVVDLVAVASVAVDATEIVAMVLQTELLQALDQAEVTADGTVALTTEALAMLTSSLYLLAEAIVAVTVVVTVDSATVTATVTAGTLARRGLTTAVGMMSRGHDAGTERIVLRLPDGDHRTTPTTVIGRYLAHEMAIC